MEEKEKNGTQHVERCEYRFTFDMVCSLPKGHAGPHRAEYKGGQPTKPPPTETAPPP
jgi:hypothetical protein